MNRESAPRDTGLVELEVEIEATANAVWHALTDPENLSNWLAPHVDGSPGEGAEWTFRWTEERKHRSRIDVWQPKEHLRWSGSVAADSAALGPASIDFRLRGEGENTALTLEISGLPGTEYGPEHLGVLKGGWIYFLYNLKYWLEEHPGTRRKMISDRRPAKEPKDKAWQRIFGRLGLGVEPRPERLGPGESFSCRLAEGVELQGKARFINPPIHFAASIDSIPGVLLFVELEPGVEMWHCGFWISAYDVDEGTRERLKQGLTGIVDRLFGPETRGP